MTADSSSQLLSPIKFAAAAGLSLATVRRRIKDGTLPAWQPGGHRTALRIPCTALDLDSTQSATRSSQENTTAPKKRSSCVRPQWMTKHTTELGSSHHAQAEGR